MPKSSTNEKAFTLIELLIVVIIISILAMLTFVSFTTVQRNARDTKRKGDLQAVAGVLQRFYSDNSQYPQASSGQVSYYASNCTSSGAVTNPVWGTDGINCGSPSKSYIKQLPKDPIGTREYCYTAVDIDPTAGINIQNYNLYARLEGTTGSLSCGGNTDYNYRVAPND